MVNLILVRSRDNYFLSHKIKKFNIIKLKNRIYTALHIKNSTIKQQINESNNKLRNEMIKRI